jgi:dihydroxyacetone kinase
LQVVPERPLACDDKDKDNDACLATTAPPNFATTAHQCVQSVAQQLIAAEPLLTKYDTIVGDGDCGITMKRGATAVLELLNQNKNLDHPVLLYTAIANAVSASMGGTSGILLELLFRKMASTLSSNTSSTTIGATELAQAFQAGVDAVSLYGGANVGSRTMMDALVPAAASLVQQPNGLAAAAQQARQGADATAAMDTASAGRSNYLSQDTLQGTPDPGAVAVAMVLEALAAAAASGEE